MTSIPRSRVLTAVAALATSFFASACSGGQGPTDPAADFADDVDSTSAAATTEHEVYVGEVAGSDARVGFVVRGRDIALFFCGGPSTLQAQTQWFHGRLERWGVTQLRDRATARVASVGRDRYHELATGVLYRNGASALSWSARRVTSGGAGLYETQAEGGTVGLLVREKVPAASGGARYDFQGAFVRGTEQVQQVTPLNELHALTVLNETRAASRNLTVVFPVAGQQHTAVVKPLQLQAAQ